jgi:hypothetical protein
MARFLIFTSCLIAIILCDVHSKAINEFESFSVTDSIGIQSQHERSKRWGFSEIGNYFKVAADTVADTAETVGKVVADTT